MTASPRVGAVLRVVRVAGLVAAFLLAYFTTLQKLTEYWGSNETYSYGFLVPVISGYLIWLRRDRLRELPCSPSFVAGGLVLAAGLLILIVGRVSSTNLVEELSLPVSVYGAVLLVLGRQMTQALTFPLLYLLAMIPFWDFITGRLHLPFQLYSAAMGVGALRLFGIPVFRQGVFIDLPNITLEVAELCSGVNNLVAVLCIGVPLTHYYVEGWLKRGFILSMAILIALFSNGVRVATVCFFAYYGIRGADGDVHGPFSLMRSLAISGIGFVVLFWLIARFANRPEQPAVSSKPVRNLDSAHVAVHTGAWALAVALLVGAGSFERLHAITPVPLNAQLVSFPNALSGWGFARVGLFLPSLASDANFDQSISRVYTAPDGTELELLLGYFERQGQGREVVGFGLSRLIPSQGTLAGSGTPRIRDGLTTAQGKTYHLTYWYLVDGRIATQAYEAKLWTTFNAITTGRSNAGVVVIGRVLPAGESIDASRSKIQGFVGEVMRETSAYFPRN